MSQLDGAQQAGDTQDQHDASCEEEEREKSGGQVRANITSESREAHQTHQRLVFTDPVAFRYGSSSSWMLSSLIQVWE